MWILIILSKVDEKVLQMGNGLINRNNLSQWEELRSLVNGGVFETEMIASVLGMHLRLTAKVSKESIYGVGHCFHNYQILLLNKICSEGPSENEISTLVDDIIKKIELAGSLAG